MTFILGFQMAVVYLQQAGGMELVIQQKNVATGVEMRAENVQEAMEFAVFVSIYLVIYTIQ